jgi:hypothetical protein
MDRELRVMVEFVGLQIRPVRFGWGKREYEVKNITMRYKRRDGGRDFMCFVVDTGGALAELRLDRESLQFSVFNFEANY